MKKTWKWMGGLALGMAFLLSACGEDNAYTNALPKDAAAVFSFDLMEMAQKCDLNDQVKQSMGQMMKSSLKGSADALVDKLMENPEESGLRLTGCISLPLRRWKWAACWYAWPTRENWKI